MMPNGLLALGFVALAAAVGSQTGVVLDALGIGRGEETERPPLIDDYVGPLDVVGINVSKHRSFQTNYPFVNIMRQADSWRSTNAGGGGFDTGFAARMANLGLMDADGYPLHLPVQPSDFPSIALSDVAIVGGVDIFGEASGSYAIVQAPGHGYSYQFGERIELIDGGGSSMGLFDITSAEADVIEIRAPGMASMSGIDAIVNPAPDVAQALNTGIFASNGQTYHEGRYVLLHDGVGTFSFDAGATLNEALSTPGRLVIDLVHHDNGLRFTIETSQQGDHVRNIRIMEESFEQIAAPLLPVFHPDYIALMTDLEGPIRVMDWVESNLQQQVHWSDRRLPSRYTQALEVTGATQGVAWELCVDLANETQRDLWICVPHRATPAYIQELAALIEGRLDPSLRVWVEYSNEVWNDDFAAWHWVDSGQIRRHTDPRANTYDPDLTWQGNIPEGYTSKSFSALLPHGRYGAFASRVFSIFEDVFGAEAMGLDGRVVRVLAGHMSRPERFDEAIPECPEFDVASIACYFSPVSQDQEALADLGALVTADDVYEAISARRMPRQKGKMDGQVKALARNGKGNVPIIAYEGGQALDAPNNAPALHQVYLQMQRDPALAAMYVEMIRSFQALGLDGLVAYNLDSGKWTNGFWGHLQGSFDDPDTSQKWGALRTLERGNFTNGLHMAQVIAQGAGAGAAWDQPAQAGAANGLYAEVMLNDAQPASAPLRLAEFGKDGNPGIDLAGAGEIAGAIVRVQGWATGAGARVTEIRLGVGATTIALVPVEDHAFGALERTFDLGEHDVLAGAGLTIADALSPEFFVEIECARDGAGDVELRIDHVALALFTATPTAPVATCPGDMNGDGQVGAADLAEVLSAWGAKGPAGDFNGSGVVDAGDIAQVLGRWGPCLP